MALRTDPETDGVAGGILPRPVDEWPGLGDMVRDGFEVDRGALRETGIRLVVDLNDIDIPHWWREPGFNAGDWGRANDVSVLFRRFSDDLFCVASDAVVECLAAACGVATAGQNYDIAENHSWLTRQSFWNRGHGPTTGVSPHAPTPRSNWSDVEKGYALSRHYPSGGFAADWEGIEGSHDYDGLSKEEIRALLMTGDESGMRNFSKVTKAIADDLDGLKGKLRSHADGVSYKWGGAAAEKAQGALKQIYEALGPLVDAHNSLSTLARRCADDIIAPAKARFDHAVADENWFTDLFQDDDDSSARNFLREVDTQLSQEVLARFPQYIRIDLPGLIHPEDRLTYHS
ncbi:WXG100 family type VII secretion target [Nonomuraea sp. NPDC050451]|uniref:WXG100 family type VII secretion target n=1 Tax=Nonomuraea sp. NPDC050451 TaxID=3364364 RepID=UPI0037AA1E38